MLENKFPNGRCIPLADVLARLIDEEGISQADIAEKAGVKPQFLSDVKNKRKKFTVGFAAKLGRAMGKKWQEQLCISESANRFAGSYLELPITQYEPVSGDPETLENWNGDTIKLSHAEAQKALMLHLPYVLKVGTVNSEEDRLRADDQVLIDQMPLMTNKCPTRDYCVVRDGSGDLTLSKSADERWIDLATGELLPEDVKVVGNAVMIISAYL
jgi:transcriptional regulator with XRE-family HTH domain